ARHRHEEVLAGGRLHLVSDQRLRAGARRVTRFVLRAARGLVAGAAAFVARGRGLGADAATAMGLRAHTASSSRSSSASTGTAKYDMLKSGLSGNGRNAGMLRAT